ncbi:hypothetical protein E3E35_01460 [Thermococcus sp. GR7]|uniref:hypothetical protein n=1 Tax=unclassified Thermococcus TaxID=2627626 RepID=UPI00142FA258|nr:MULTISPECIES: hypothetical protein [unclassified Thermococcus]NJE46097.1 hypothetical protein [Thermococcus sp. GR7]NJE78267.1 hypothetical protein [Thermococcus sp. GR4]NJF22294.1 hypothetical protein [Thermococcus sp. GR5]
MGLHKAVVIVGAVLLLIATIAGSYMVRWLAVLFLGIFLAFFLFGIEIRVARPRLRRSMQVKRKTDVDRTIALIDKAKTGKVARSLVEEKIIDIYATLSDDYNSTYRSLLSEPNEALKALRSERDFLDNLEKALKIVEADLNEGRRGKPEG